MEDSKPSWLFFFLASLSLSLLLFFTVSEESTPAGHSVVDFLLLVTVKECVSVCARVCACVELDWIIGVELPRAQHLELMSHMMKQEEQRQPPILLSHPSILMGLCAHMHLFLYKHICVPLTSSMCNFYNKPAAE